MDRRGQGSRWGVCFPGFDAESAVELLLEGAELVPGAGEIGTVFIVCWKTKPVRRRMAKW